ncbi:DCL family protein [Serratia nevei]|uniref:DUF3223 domain-containing protein n=1 Tax=Serratia nevei TaxID=2703794 RepID=UPI0020A11036|nr:DUF3223 domain-containing protein [Serratia nevei]MCP1103962.1 DCL family protein [Serratia nevei]
MSRDNYSFHLGDYVYKNKNELKESIKNFLQRAREGIVTHPETIEKLHYLLVMHPKAACKIGVGVKDFSVTSNTQGAGKGFEIIRKDNSRERFSYKACIDGERQTRRAKTVEALRFIIRQQMIDFRRSLQFPVRCAISGKLIHNNDELHIDHHIPFWELVTEFLEEESLTLEQLETSGSGEYLRLIDETVSRGFFKFHERNAKLQPTLKEYNIKKGGGYQKFMATIE